MAKAKLKALTVEQYNAITDIVADAMFKLECDAAELLDIDFDLDVSTKEFNNLFAKLERMLAEGCAEMVANKALDKQAV